jgi:DNA polymerase epsilon subunit 2
MNGKLEMQKFPPAALRHVVSIKVLFFVRQFAKTLTSQAHLCPLPSEVCPVYWPYDHALYLYPLPDVVVVGDRFGGFMAQHMDCTVFNPVNCSFLAINLHFRPFIFF